MRLRISSDIPGLPFKVWFQASPTILAIADLVHALFDGLVQLKDSEYDADDVLLVLDEFELLPGSTTDILRDGDLVCLRPRLSGSRKRPAKAHDSPSPRKRAKRASLKPAAKALQVSSSSSDSSTSSSSSDSSSSSSDSDSDDSSSPPTPRTSKLAPKPPPPPHAAVTLTDWRARPPSSTPSQNQPLTQTQPALPGSVPPGEGSLQTRSRNARRRKKRMAEKLGVKDASAAAATRKAAVLARLHPPPTAAASTSTSAEGVEIAMASLSNKNKRRGFKHAAVHRPAKIIFDGPVSSFGAPETPRARLVPPSERALPPNVFVTSVDVEADVWNKAKGKGKKKDTRGEEYGGGYGNGGGYASVEEEEAPVVLDYGGADGAEQALEVDWEALETLFDACPLVGAKAQMPPGTVLGWTALGLDPRTCTPEPRLLHLARVVSYDPDAGALALTELARPESGEVEAESVVEWGRVVRDGWRVVTLMWRPVPETEE